ncbi:hypothetical protein DdX_18396 [Ditylenchus destructor]|uniref:Uncharacterized protein n=1 Tax=Ditylenchus destructor TaxID=166010 RepID=A0AAD4MLN6_9BILA|nr:hypothetical protein DdX_18396 [Ditylenchus destructor]
MTRISSYMRFITALHFLRYSELMFASASSPETIPYAYYLLSGQGEPDTTKTIDDLYQEGQLNTDSLKSMCVWHSTSVIPFLCSIGCPQDGYMWKRVTPPGRHFNDYRYIPQPNGVEMPDFGLLCFNPREKALCCRWDLDSTNFGGLWLDLGSMQLASCVYYGPGDKRIRYNSRCGTVKCKKDGVHMIVNVTGLPSSGLCDTVTLFGGYGVLLPGHISFMAPDATELTTWIKLKINP